jgi:hypothetical protein
LHVGVVTISTITQHARNGHLIAFTHMAVAA